MTNELLTIPAAYVPPPPVVIPPYEVSDTESDTDYEDSDEEEGESVTAEPIGLPPPPPMTPTPPPAIPESNVRPRVLELVEVLSSMVLSEKEGVLLRSLTAYLN